MSEQINLKQHQAEEETPTSGLLLSVKPLPGSALQSFAPRSHDDDNPPADVDADDTVGDTDHNDDTDQDTNDDADGTD